MRVFISWSGPSSQRFAEILRGWLPAVVQVTRPYYSTDDTEKGTRWSGEIARELDESQVGLICLTRDNLEAPWIMFEAGALAKHLDQSRVCPILFGIGKSEVTGPLAQFQLATFEEAEVRRVVRTVNSALGEGALDAQVLDRVFDVWWPKLEDQVRPALEGMQAEGRISPQPQRDIRNILEELLQLTRSIAYEAPARPQTATAREIARTLWGAPAISLRDQPATGTKGGATE